MACKGKKEKEIVLRGGVVPAFLKGDFKNDL